jgi:hypothetical protein
MQAAVDHLTHVENVPSPATSEHLLHLVYVEEYDARDPGVSSGIIAHREHISMVVPLLVFIPCRYRLSC